MESATRIIENLLRGPQLSLKKENCDISVYWGNELQLSLKKENLEFYIKKIYYPVEPWGYKPILIINFRFKATDFVPLKENVYTVEFIEDNLKTTLVLCSLKLEGDFVKGTAEHIDHLEKYRTNLVNL